MILVLFLVGVVGFLFVVCFVVKFGRVVVSRVVSSIFFIMWGFFVGW